ncbi:MAG TPA: hypothetical protein VN999_15350 [Thermoanaerobaculia bacterium]|nr:hypothetical protein [Thermoanaerobaculia bacterium]
MQPIGPTYRPPRLPGKGWVLVAAGGFRLVPGQRDRLVQGQYHSARRKRIQVDARGVPGPGSSPLR